MLQEIRILRHDYKHQIEVIRELANISKVKYIQKYLESAMDAYDQTEPSVYCENLVVNVLLSSYSERYSKNNIAFSIEASLPAEIPQLDKSIEPLDTYEICIVLGNILENALEAVLLVPPEQRRVSLLMKLQDGRLFIEEKNSFDGRITLGDGRSKTATLPASRKGRSGGFGLQSVMAVCKRHCGEYIPKWTDNEYTVYILLNL
jgi:sensor histidine kinase regulating citrate/malate metabolism